MSKKKAKSRGAGNTKNKARKLKQSSSKNIKLVVKTPARKGAIRVKPIAIAASITLLVLTLGFGSFSFAFEQKILPGIKVAGIDLGGKSLDEAREILHPQIQELNRNGVVLVSGDKTVQSTFTNLGISFQLDRDILNAYNVGHQGGIWQQLWHRARSIFIDHNLPLATKIHQERFDQATSELTSPFTVPAQNATLQIEASEIKVVAEKPGTKLDLGQFRSDLETALRDPNQNHILLKQTVWEPTIKEADTAPAAELAKAFTSAPLTLSFPEQSFTADVATIGSWITFPEKDGKLVAELSDEKINGFIAGMAAKIDRKPVTKEIDAPTGNVLKEGQNGRSLNRAQALAEIKTVLTSSARRPISLSVADLPFKEKKIYPGFELGKFEGRYIEINLSQQRLYLIESNNLVAQFAISTGKWSTPTPIGVRYIQSKTALAWSATYGLYMPYWNSIGGGYGIHELPYWPGGAREGESHLGSPASHGCIRLGRNGPAETLFNWAPIGSPVYIHK